MSQYKLIFTNIGLSKKQNAELNNDYIEITEFAVGSGVILTLVPSMTALMHEEYRADINNVDTKNGTTVFDLIIPSSVGGFYIKEVALFDVDGDCICIGTVPITYKVNQDEGASKAIHLKVSTTSTNTENIVFNTDDSLVYATVSYVNNSVNTLRNEMLLELPKKVNVLDVKNGLFFSDTDKPLSAAMGKLLKQYIDNINTLLLSDNSAIDNLQEIVDFIELHQATLDTLGIANIAGLQNALNAKLGLYSNAASASKLFTARFLGGVSFDGTADINLPGVNTKGNQDTSGNAENLIIPAAGYKHVGSWGIDGITGNGAILVNSAYRAEKCLDLSNHQWAGYGTTGFERRSTGIIEQWGDVYFDFTENQSIDVYFATSFPSSCYNVVLCPLGSTSVGNDNGSLELITKYTNRFTVRSNSQSHIQGVSYMAKGV